MVEISTRDTIVARKIINEIDVVNEFISEMTVEDFYEDNKTQRAVSMTLINIGELTKSFTEDFLSSNKGVPWKKIQAMRNIAAHNYEAFDMQVVWKTVKEDLLLLRYVLYKGVSHCQS